MHPTSIQSFAIFDLETNGLPAHNFNRVAITELSIYGIAAKDLLDGPGISSLGTPAKVPKKPRILHKLNLLFNPQMVIAPDAERITGLDNYMLEHETPFNKNAGNLILNFLQHLKQPVCLVAHNGWNFDMPILKKLLEKVEVHLPVTTMCVDSFAAFKEIDSNLENTEALSKRMPVEEPETLTENIVETTDVAKEECDGNKSPKNESETIIDLTDSDKTLLLEIEQVLADNDKIDWRAINETTPKRPIKQSRLKRKSDEDEAAVDDVEGTTRKKRFDLTLKSRRSLDYSRKPKGYYTLSSVYQRVFGEPFADAHHAEADVDALMKIMQYYAQDFVDFANLCARPYAEVLNVGARWQNF